MKITDSRPLMTTPARANQRARAKGGADFSSQLAEEPSAAGAAPSTARLGAVNGILAVQEVPDATDGRTRGLKRGYDILDQLDDIRLGLLNGSFARSRLVELGQDIKEAKDQVIDPELSSILDDIELRAAVELAKLGHMI